MFTTIGRKLGLGFAIVIALPACGAVFCYVKVNDLLNNAVQSAMACDQLIEEIETSIDQLRAYVISGEESLKGKRSDAWREIDLAIAKLDQKITPSPSNEDRRRFNNVRDKLMELRSTQSEVENLANSQQTNEEGSKYSQMHKLLTDILNEEEQLEAIAERKQLLKYVADSRGSLGAAIAEVRAYGDTGEETAWQAFQLHWAANQEAMDSTVLLATDFMTELQRDNWLAYVDVRNSFMPLPEKLKTLRDEASGIANELRDLRAAARQRQSAAARAVKTTLVVSTLIALLVGSVVALGLGRGISSQVGELVSRADEIAHGQLTDERLEVRSADELGRLASTFNIMTVNLKEMISKMASQEEMLSAKTRITAILSATADGIITIDCEGLIQSVNPPAERLFGYSADEILGKNISMLAPSPYQEEHDGYLRRYLKTGEARIVGLERELQGLRKDRSTFPMALRVTEMRLDERLFFIGTVQDISDRKATYDAVSEAVHQLATASREILATTSQQATGAQEQAASVAETVATVEELAQSAEQAAERANEVAEAARRTDEVGQAGRLAVQESVEAMSEVRQQVEALAENILALAEQAYAIGEITATVNDIAEQTNVLALNAAVEASRAGEHGRGFAVVASEVKSLALQSKKATGQVRKILGEIQKATNSAVLTTEQGTKAVNRANEVVSQAGRTINTLSETIKDSARTASQISAAANQQAAGVLQVNQGTKSIDKVTQENILAIRQIEQAARNLNDLSNQLSNLTRKDELS